MEQEQTAPGAPASRRDLHPRREPRVSRRSARLARWFPRTLIIGALGSATIAVPMLGIVAPTSASTPAVVATADSVPTAEILSADPQWTTDTSLLAPDTTTPRAADAVSRSLARDPLPDCRGVVDHTSGNGEIPASDLCLLWDGVHMLRGDAAVTLTELNQNFHAAFNRDLCLVDAYRTLAVQRRLKYTKPGLAATPGTSNHGWGLAIDLCGQETHNRAVMSWLAENGPTFGWANPPWAKPGGSGAYEPWHWEYVPGTVAMGTNWS